MTVFLEPLHTLSLTGQLVKLLLRQDCILLLLSHLWWNYCQTMQMWKIFTWKDFWMQGQATSVVKKYMVMQLWHLLDTHGGLKNFFMKMCPSNHITGLFLNSFPWISYFTIISLFFSLQCCSNLNFDASLMCFCSTMLNSC